MSNNSLQVKTGYADVWRISWPIMLSSLANTVITFTDTAFVGRIGETELAAAAIGGVLYFVLIMLGVAIGIGAQIMIARMAGENKIREIGRIFDHSILLLLFLATIIVIACYTTPGQGHQTDFYPNGVASGLSHDATPLG